MLWRVLGAVAAAVAIEVASLAAEPEVSASDLPRVPATEAAEAHKTFTLREGYRIELAAHEPNVVDPVAVAFDEDARMFVIEMRDYSERREEQLGRVRLLEDADNDGVYEKATVFAEGLPWPTAIICYGGGVFVGSTPDILFLKDTNGDGRADETRVVFTGFAKQQVRLNVQQLMNSFHWGLDNRIHGSSASNGGVIEQVGAKKAAVNIGSRDFSFDPRELTIRAESGGGQHGMSFDNFGRKFVSNNSSHIRQIVYEDRYVRGEVPFPLPSAVVDIAADGPAAEVFRTSPEEPWRRLRTQWRVAGQVSGPIEGGGRSAGYFTGATGVHIYRGDACPELMGNAFVGDAGGNLAHRKLLKPNGVLFTAVRPEDELNREFLASRDNWFRPVQFANAPDGSLYVIDMYREVIEHPWSLPANIKKHLDLNSGNDRGRIWRVVPKDFRRRAQLKLSNAPMPELVGLLAHPNAWHRETASRLIFERQDGSGVEQLRALVADSRTTPMGMAHVLQALAALKELRAEELQIALNEFAPPEVIERALIHLESLPAQDQARLTSRLPIFSKSARVLHQMAWTIGALEIGFKARALSGVAESPVAAHDSWIRTAVLVSGMSDKERLWQILLRRGEYLRRPGAGELLRPLARMLPAELLIKTLSAYTNTAATNRAAAFLLASAVAEPISKTAEGKAMLQPFVEQAAAEAVEAPSAAAIALLRAADPEKARPTFAKLFASAKDEGVRMEAFRGLLPQADVAATNLFAQWGSLPSRVRQTALDALLGVGRGAVLTMAALRDGRITRGDLSASQIMTLRQHPDPAISRPALEIFGKVDADRAAVLERYRAALSLEGDARAGTAIFEQRCASCHRLGGRGTAMGPDLESVRANGREYLLTHIIDPNREVAARYVAYEADVGDESIMGIMVTENDDAVTLQVASGEQKTIARSSIRRLRASANSLMPVGLEEGLSAQEMANLLAHVSDARAAAP